MNIGFLGAGTVAQTIAKHILALGHQVLLSNSRGPETLSALVEELGHGAAAGTPLQAAEQDFVVLAVGWPRVQLTLSAVPDWSGKLLIDATNRFAAYAPPALGDLSGRTSSEIVADLAPGAKVVKAFNSVPMSWIADFSPSKQQVAIFMSGDDGDAKQKLGELIDQIGFCAIDLGSLAVGGRLQQLGGSLAGMKLIFNQKLVL